MNPASERMLQHFTSAYLPPELRTISAACATLAQTLAEQLDSADPLVGAEVTTGIRKMVEACDCFKRAREHLPMK